MTLAMALAIAKNKPIVILKVIKIKVANYIQSHSDCSS
jgi:hypothetical protein